VLRCLRRLATWIGTQHALARSWHAHLAAGAADAAADAAWAHLRGTEGPMDAALRTLLQVLAAAEADARDARAALAPPPPAEALSVLRVWREEVDAGIGASLRWVAHAQAAAAPFRIGTFAAYVEASELILELCFRHVTAAAAAFAHRRAWMVALAGEGADAAEASGEGGARCAHLARVAIPPGEPPQPGAWSEDAGRWVID
jgi:hypothetical protein